MFNLNNKQMKLKCTFWALAFACAAVSCSDDMDGGPNVNGNGENGETAKVNVVINTETVTKSATKATPGENGDGADQSEIGSADEYTVHDVTLLLYSAPEGSELTSLAGTYTLVAAGWTDQVGIMSDGSVTTGTPAYPNTKQTTVEVKVKDPSTTLVGGTYGVLAVTNLGKSKGEGLVDKIGDTYKTVAALDNELFEDQISGNFVMSTHALDGSAGESTVTFTEGTSEIPTTSVYVERLSAKIRIAPNNDSYTYSIEDNDTKVAEVVLNSVAIVNQLNSGSYLLKRVSGAVTDDLDMDNATSDKLIGDETAANGAGTNFVIDPWTRMKKLADISKTLTNASANVALAYTNQFTESTYGTLWNSYTTVALDANNKSDNGKQRICYTQENTTSIANSINGYSTGAIFQATYYPTQWSVLDETTGAVTPTPIEYDKDSEGAKIAKKFYTYGDAIYQNHKAILGYIIATAGKDKNVTYASFSDPSDKEDFATNIKYLSHAADLDPYGYISAMLTEADKDSPAFKTPGDFLASFDESALTGEAKTDFDALVQTYTDGKCYYPHWIRHADNGQPTAVGPMEFGIVRNNIYDMKVTAIKHLGLSEVDPTDPTNPDEENTLSIEVELYVKDWVVRSNENIMF